MKNRDVVVVVVVEDVRAVWLSSVYYWRSAERQADRLEAKVGHSMILRSRRSLAREVCLVRDEEYWEALAAYLEFLCALDESIVMGAEYRALRAAAAEVTGP